MTDIKLEELYYHFFPEKTDDISLVQPQLTVKTSVLYSFR